MTIKEDKQELDIDSEEAKETAPEEAASSDEDASEQGASSDVASSIHDAIRAALHEDDEDDADKEKDDGKDPTIKDGCCLRILNGRGCCGRCMSRWPRFWACFLGVVLPLWLLIAQSVVFGYFLAHAEAPNELQANNVVMESQASVRALVDLIIGFVGTVPTICLSLYFSGRNATDIENEFNLIFDGNEQFGTHLTSADAIATILEDDLEDAVLVCPNKTEMFEFMDTCGSQARPFVEAVVNRTGDFAGSFDVSLQFNWIRCVPWATGLDGSMGRNVNMTSLQPEIQEQLFRQVWWGDQEQLNAQYLQENLDANMTGAVARVMAFTDSVHDATGGSKCEVNTSASSWFWFTIMTTVGYGNQAPTTSTGRCMIYTLGFMSILVFGAILTVAGYIASFLMDDLAVRMSLQWLTTPFIACLVWGGGYYAWMLLIAGYTKVWKERRLEIDFSLREGYWFSYISTTTVGLGDIILEPEVIVEVDLVIFPLLFLLGFVILSSFLGKLAAAIGHSARRRRRNVVDALLGKVKDTQVVPDDLQDLADFGIASDDDGDEAAVEGQDGSSQESIHSVHGGQTSAGFGTPGALGAATKVGPTVLTRPSIKLM